MIVFDSDMNDKQQVPSFVHSDYRVSHFLLWARINDTQERIKERFLRLFKSHTVLFEIFPRFHLTPNERDSIQLEALIHNL